eukprot:4636755-Prymnesium_polylepis.1
MRHPHVTSGPPRARDHAAQLLLRQEDGQGGACRDNRARLLPRQGRSPWGGGAPGHRAAAGTLLQPARAQHGRSMDVARTRMDAQGRARPLCYPHTCLCRSHKGAAADNTSLPCGACRDYTQRGSN